MTTHNKYIDAAMKLLDPRYRELEPAVGDQACVGMSVRSFDATARTVEAVVSTAQVDRYEEIVEPKAYRKWLKNFMANPVLMPGHQYTRADGKPAQIGTWLDLRIEADGLVGTAWFDEDDTADAWWRKYSNPDPKKRAKGFSVGFLSHAWEMREYEIKSNRRRLRVFTEVELLEISAVPVPANRGALARAASALAHVPDGDHDAGESAKIAQATERLISEAVAKAVAKELDSDLNGRLASLIESIVDACQGRQVPFGNDDAKIRSGASSESLVQALKRLAGEA